MDNSLYVDNSLLSDVQCSTKLFLRHLHGYTSLTEKATLKAGSAAHEALPLWFTAKDKTKGTQEAMAKFENEYRDFADSEVPPDDRLSWENTSLILEDWMQHQGLEVIKGVEFIDKFVEVGFAYSLDPVVEAVKARINQDEPEFVFCGRFDALVRWRGEVFVWENKTTGGVNAWFKDRLRLGSQLTGYLWAAKKIVSKYAVFKELKVSGAIVNAIEFKKVPDSDRRCSTHGVKYSECGLQHLGHAFLGPYGKTPEDLVEWQKTALHLAKKYKELLTQYTELEHLAKVRTQGKFFGACQNCEMSDFCLAGRPLDKIDSMLALDPWSPYESVIQTSQVMYKDETNSSTKAKTKTSK